MAKIKRKTDWATKVLGKKSTKTERTVLKGVVYGVGALALIGAGNEVLKRIKK